MSRSGGFADYMRDHSIPNDGWTIPAEEEEPMQGIPSDAINISVFKDGNKWSAVMSDSFENLQKSPCGFGDTPQEAVANLFFIIEQGE